MYKNLSFTYKNTQKDLFLKQIEKIELKEIYPILEWHALIIEAEKWWYWIFWYWTHTCALITIENKSKIWMAHIHEWIAKEAIKEFIKEFKTIKKINVIWWSKKIINKIKEIFQNLNIENTQYIASQYDALIYKNPKNKKTWLITTNNITNTFKNPSKHVNNHIKSWLYIIFSELKNQKKYPLIIETKKIK